MVLLPVFYAKVYLIPHNNLNGSVRSIQCPGCIGYRENLLCTLHLTCPPFSPVFPVFFQRSGKMPRKAAAVNYKCAIPKSPPRPGMAVALTRSAWGYSAPPRLPSCEDNSFARSRLWFRSKLKLHFQKAIFTRECSTSKQN